MQKYHKQQDLKKVQTYSTTYLGKTDMTRDIIIKAEAEIPKFCKRVHKWHSY